MMIVTFSLDEIQRVRAYAERREHWYRPPIDTTPGDGYPHTCHVAGVRCVFTWTVGTRGVVVRHLSMSLDREPPPVTLGTAIAREFGFSDDMSKWQCALIEEPHPHVVLIEPIEGMRDE